jgi:hypothetical protein
MKLYDSEITTWRNLRAELKAPPPLSIEQLAQINAKSKELLLQTTDHRIQHNTLGLLLIALLLILDLSLFTVPGATALVIATLLHSFLAYSLTVYTMHEGAGHKRIILGSNTPTKFLSKITNNLSRLFFSDPYHYSQMHPSHHSSLGTERDLAFTQVVEPIRIAKCFLPLAGILPFNDYKIHGDDKINRSGLLSLLIGGVYHSVLIWIASKNHNFYVSLFAIVGIAPWIGFSLDRLRETSEHLLMKSDDLPEARDLGANAWGYLIGGGPWGQPCHLTHHCAPALPWYQQIRLSRFIKQTMTDEQRRHYFVPEGLLSYPIKFSKLIKENRQAFKRHT